MISDLIKGLGTRKLHIHPSTISQNKSQYHTRSSTANEAIEAKSAQPNQQPAPTIGSSRRILECQRRSIDRLRLTNLLVYH